MSSLFDVFVRDPTYPLSNVYFFELTTVEKQLFYICISYEIYTYPELEHALEIFV